MAAAARIDQWPQVRLVMGQQFAAISASSSGDNIVVAAVVGRQIRLIKYSLVCAAPVVITWKSSVAGAISGPESYAANGGIADYCPEGIMQTAQGEALVINLNGNVSVGGKLTYVLV